MFLEAHDLRVVQQAEKISDEVWHLVRQWGWFDKKIVGEQLVRSCDSIGANLTEGYGRHHGPDTLRFYYMARGSLEETRYWLRRVKTRRLCDINQADTLLLQIQELSKSMNAFITVFKNRAINKENN
jgi:four helix bundle protein